MQPAEILQQPSGTLVVALAKHPLEGKVKTRLASTTGDAAALSYYRQLLSTHLQNVDRFLREENVDTARAGRIDWDRVQSDNAAESADLPWLESGLQCSGTIGDRMSAVHRSFMSQRRFSRLLITGSDCPYLLPERLAEAEEALERNDCVFVPAIDGGYVLLGFSQTFDSERCDLFNGMPWSTPQLMFATQTRLDAAGIDYSLLAPLEDVDEEPALQRWLLALPEIPAGT